MTYYHLSISDIVQIITLLVASGMRPNNAWYLIG